MITTISDYLKPKNLLKSILKKEVEAGLSEIRNSEFMRDLDFGELGLNFLGSSSMLVDAAILEIKNSLINQAKVALGAAGVVSENKLDPSSSEYRAYVAEKFEKFFSYDLAQWCLKKEHENFEKIRELSRNVFESRVAVYSKLMGNWEKGLEAVGGESNFCMENNLEKKKCMAYNAVVRATYNHRDEAYRDYDMELKYQKQILDTIEKDRSILWMEEVKIPFTSKVVKVSQFGIDPGKVGQMLFPVISASYFYAECRLSDNVEGIYQTVPAVRIAP